eukprot:TRINITY_DN4543_c0_g1_i2.p1 TRINITY_DN4543_c0_g1~~TRINITY_DN4543_c0_g1_i2.p1  ORF type:complete len:334 (+),score=69.92 TRINITY_DN4543_c0_g1_i2:126-1127(+)
MAETATPTTTPTPTPTLFVEKHTSFIKALEEKKDTFEYWVTEHLRVSGVYWGLTSLELVSRLHLLDHNKETLLDWLCKCQTPEGGFGGNVGHDPHLLYTMSAVQVFCLYDSLHRINKEALVSFIVSLQKEDGSFTGDQWGEVDTRFSYIAVACLSLIGRLEEINRDKAAEFILKCKNFDGAFGCTPGAESHAGQTFCCVGALTILGKQSLMDVDLLGWWLAERQLPDGGLNGRPEKLPDVCYSWWVVSSLACIDRLTWIDKNKLIDFILNSQDPDHGGIADRPEDLPDVFHTFFGIAGLSLLGYPGLAPIDPAYAVPVSTLARLSISPVVFRK